MKTCYLIDFENVNDVVSLKGCQNFTASDEVHIFYTDNVPHINLEITFGDAMEKRHKVMAGSQSIDMHIATFLGNHIIELHDNNKEIPSYVIVSKDRGYDNIVSFWKTMGMDIVRKNDVRADKKVANLKPVSEELKIDNNKTKSAKEERAKIKIALNTRVQRLLSEEYDDAKFTNEVASLVVKCYGHENFVNSVHNALRQQYGVEFKEVFDILRPVLKEFSKLSI